MIALKYLTLLLVASLLVSCEKQDQGFAYFSEQFADLYIARYQVPGFEELSPKQKELLYYLYQAGLSGRDILYDQNYKYNLLVRRTLEAIVNGYTGDRSTDDFAGFMVYTKRVWFSNGIHHHYSNAKLVPGFSPEYFADLVHHSTVDGLPLKPDQTVDQFIDFLTPIIFDPGVAAKKVNLDPNVDQVARSATNFYEGLTQKEVEAYYASIIDQNDPTPISYGLNAKLVKENGRIREKVWKVGGMYTEAIEQIVFWLENASSVAENDQQKATFDHLIAYYRTGDLRTFDDYNMAWVQDVDSRIDVINGFIEVYNDPLGYHGSFESVVSIKDLEATKRIETISQYAQWFEDNSPLMDAHKKPEVKGISAKVITVVVETGDASPSTPIGINLPNSNWIRTNYGSKSVSLGNIVHAYTEARKGNGFIEEFASSEEEIALSKKWGTLAGDLHTDMHEVIGHASGRINPGVGTPKETLKSYSSSLEEARADLVALYYIMDPKLIEIGAMPSLDVGRTEYNGYIRNGLMTQLTRILPGDQIEQAHMRNRQLVAAWVYERGQSANVIEKVSRDSKTYTVINDYDQLRQLFGELLREIQRIKSEGDYEAGKQLIETYGVKVDQQLHAEVLERYATLGIAPYGGFINPQLIPVIDGDRIVDVKIEYPADFTGQMLHYAREYSFLPTDN